MNNLLIYISGPMTGLPDYNYPAFNEAAEYIKSLGHNPINPARHPAGLSYDQYMDYAILDVCCADLVVLLPGFADSKGCKVEVKEAFKNNTSVILLSALGDYLDLA